MKRNHKHNLPLVALTLFAVTVSLPTAAQDKKEPYPNMAPIKQYLMNRDAEIKMARSAAPDAISKDATVLVLNRHGYETAAQGSNGWVCFVGRSWGAMFDHPEFWNPKVRGAACFNPPAARSVLPYELKRTELLLAGKTKVETIAALKSAIDKKQFPALEHGTICYMMGKDSYLTDDGNHNGPHLMIYKAEKDGAIWGANVKDSPIVAVNNWYVSPEAFPELKGFPPLQIFLVGTKTWADGTPSAAAHHN